MDMLSMVMSMYVYISLLNKHCNKNTIFSDKKPCAINIQTSRVLFNLQSISQYLPNLSVLLIFIVMSHSDSEVRDEEKERRRKLGSITKAKFRCRIDSNPILKTKELKQHLKPILAELKLIRCVNNNNVEETKNLLESGVSANSTDSLKRSALHIAVSRGYRDVVELLLKHGADPNKRDSIQNTPLHLAACSHNLAIITLLITAGADVDSQDMHGRHPLQLAKSKLQIIQRIWQQGHIEMTQLKTEVKDVIDLMISVQSAKQRGSSDFAPINPTEEVKLRINNLQNIKLTLNDHSNVDYQVDELLTSLQNFQIS